MNKRMARSFALVAALTLIISIGFASSSNSLPWGMDWDTTVTDYVESLVQQTASQEYSLKELSGGIYSVTQAIQNGNQSIAYYAEFIGEITSGKITEHNLQDIANKNLRMNWMGIDYAPIGSDKDSRYLTNGEALAEFTRLYDQFRLQYGDCTPNYSYINTINHDIETWFVLPVHNSSINFDSINRYIQAHHSSIETFWLVLGNGNASCRFYFTAIQDADGNPDWLWRISYYFTKGQQNTIPNDALVFQ